MMKKISLLTLSLLTVLLVGISTVAAQPSNFRAHLSGAEEVPPVDTKAQGQAIFQLSADGTELRFKLIVANIENVTAAHIHCGPAGANGPVVTWLYPLDGPPGQLIEGRFNGVLAEGIRTNDNVMVVSENQSPACPGGVADFAELIDKIRSGEAYVNVHTSQHGGGEIRGQIR